MRYVPKKPRDGINVSDEHPLVEATTLIVGLSAIFLGLILLLIFLVEIAIFFIPAETEARLFDSWLPDDLVTVSPSDTRLNETQLLVDRLAAHWPDSPYEIRLEIEDSDAANAMALPGGLIVVTQGLLDEVESENELAFVLGHELGHFRNRDHLRALGRGIVLSMLFAVVTGGDVSGIGVNIADATLRGFSRRQEAAADEFGLTVVYAEYGHVDEAWRLFERWDERDGDDFDIVDYFSTHPTADDRIEQLVIQAEQEDWPLRGEVTPLQW